ncbi:hypothetical protein, partial [Mycobacterium malmoense]|uniref:hypothetical protein n=1 Tax=Mycobacterium malmoense TaxID=1780 RepID=UPI001C400F61
PRRCGRSAGWAARLSRRHHRHPRHRPLSAEFTVVAAAPGVARVVEAPPVVPAVAVVPVVAAAEARRPPR